MRLYGTITAVSLAAALAACGASAKQQRIQVAAGSCTGMDGNRAATELYGNGKVARVEPLQRQVFLARAIQPTLTYGAHLYVPAEAGMHEAYLERVLTCHAARGAGSAKLANDPLLVPGVERVAVSAQGPLMRISVEGRDARAGEAIWKSARSLHGDVSVEQLAANATQAASF